MASTSAPSLPGLEDLPNAPKLTLASNITLQPPLSRRGHGPGLIIVDPGYDLPDFPSAEPPSTTLDPAPQYKWAEEGYAVVRITIKPLAADGDVQLSSALEQSIQALNDLTECDTKGQFALLSKRTKPSLHEHIRLKLTNHTCAQYTAHLMSSRLLLRKRLLPRSRTVKASLPPCHSHKPSTSPPHPNHSSYTNQASLCRQKCPGSHFTPIRRYHHQTLSSLVAGGSPILRQQFRIQGASRSSRSS